MDVQLLESLLYREESETLDFKRGQYPFDKANDDERAELLKDLLAFANAWRTTDAYILVGVEEVRGNRSVVHGVTQRLLNRNLQQFVQSKTNRPLTFSYSGVKFEGRDVGVITIPVQDRPFYLVKDFRQLKANVVYIRRGDTTGIAAPDEVFKMGRAVGSARKEPALTWEFADLSNRVKVGAKVEITSQYAIVPPASTIPSYGQSASVFSTAVDLLANRDYYVEIAEWVHHTMLLEPLGLVITNAATVAAEEVILTLEFDAAKVVAVAESDMPIRPSRERIPSIRPFRNPEPRRVEVSQFGDLYEVRAYMGTVQPGTTAWAAEPFYMGARETASIRVTATASADNLGMPETSSAEICIKAAPRKISVDDIVGFSRSE
ncbi:MAG: ATP-binding protein [Candidatus Sulfotelmatobacter sp.]